MAINKKTIVIGITAISVLTILYFSYRKATDKNIETDPALKKDYEEIMNKIRNAKT